MGQNSSRFLVFNGHILPPWFLYFSVWMILIFSFQCCYEIQNRIPDLSQSRYSKLLTNQHVKEVDSLIQINRITEAAELLDKVKNQKEYPLSIDYLTYKINKGTFYHNFFYPNERLPFLSFDSIHPAFYLLNNFYARGQMVSEDIYIGILSQFMDEYPEDSILQAEMNSEIGRYYFNEGNNPKISDDYYTRSVDFFLDNGIHSHALYISIWNLSFLQFSLRNLYKALAYMEKIDEAIAEYLFQDEGLVIIKSSFLAYCKLNVGKLEESKRLFYNAFELARSLPCSFAQQELYKYHFAFQWNFDQSYIAETSMDHFKSIIQECGDFSNFGKIYGEYLLYFKMDPLNALTGLKDAFDYIQHNQPVNTLQLSTVMDHLMIAYNKTGQYDKALDMVYSSYSAYPYPNRIQSFQPDSLLSERMLIKSFLYVGLTTLAEILVTRYEQFGDISDLMLSFKWITKADSLLDVAMLTFDESVIESIYKTSVKVYETGSYISYLLYQKTRDEEYLAEYFYLIEKNRSRILYRDRQFGKFDDQEITALFEREKKIRQKLMYFTRNWNPDSLMKTKQILQEFNHQFFSTQQHTLSYFGKSRMTDTTLFIFHLKEGELYLDISVIHEDVFISYISHDIKGIRRVPLSNSLKVHMEMLNRANRLHLDLKPKDYNSSAYLLFDELISEIIDDKKFIYYTTGGIFSDINLETWCYDVDNEADTYQDLPFLIKKWTFEKIVSVYLHEEVKMSDPLKVSAFLHSSQNTILANHKRYVKELPGNLLEKASLMTFYTETRIYEGYNCTKKKLFSQLQERMDILHISLHGFGDSDDREKTYLLFRQKGLQPDTLFGYEFLHLTGMPELVILAGCETGKGPYLKGEGSYSIARYFIQAGSKRVLNAIWNLEDLATGLLFQNFYDYLPTFNVSESLTLSKRSLIENYPNKAHPYYWGGLL